LVEDHLYGKDAWNVIACEGKKRVERPKTYRRWQLEFRKLALDYKVVARIM